MPTREMIRNWLRSLTCLSLVLLFGACSSPLDGGDHQSAVGVDVTDMAGALLASYRSSSGVWTIEGGDAFQIEQGEERSVRIFFVEADGDRFQRPASGAEYTHRVVAGNASIIGYQGEAEHGRFTGLSTGSTTAVIQLYHRNHADFATNPGMPIQVVAP